MKKPALAIDKREPTKSNSTIDVPATFLTPKKKLALVWIAVIKFMWTEHVRMLF